MSQGISTEGVIKAPDYDCTILTTLTISNDLGVVKNKPESVIAEYGSESIMSVSSGKSSVTSTPASGSPVPFATVVNNMAGWSNEVEYINDSQSLIPKNAQEAMAISQGHKRALGNMNEVGMADDEPSPANPLDILIALHRRHTFDNPLLDFADEESRERMSNDSGKLGVTHYYGVVGGDVEKQDRAVRLKRKRYDLYRLLKQILLAFALGFAVVGCYRFWAI